MLSYAEAAELLNTTVEAVLLRALRGRWQKTIGNDRCPADECRERKPRNDVRTTFERAVDPAPMNALEAHIETLKGENEALKSLAERLDALAAERARPWWRRLVG
jgi:hypothetical protein